MEKLGYLDGQSLTSALSAFVDWRQRVERWARLNGAEMEDLTPRQIEDAAPHFLEGAMLRELRERGKLAVSWVSLLRALRLRLDLTVSTLQEAMHRMRQKPGESLEQYAIRFELMRTECGLEPREAKRAIVNRLTEGGRRELARRLEQIGAIDPGLSEEENADQLEYEVIMREMRRPDALAGFGGCKTARPDEDDDADAGAGGRQGGGAGAQRQGGAGTGRGALASRQ